MTLGQRPGIALGGYGPVGATTRERIARDLATALNHLIHLELDITRAFDTAMRRLSDPSLRRNLRGLQLDHHRHVREIGACVEKLGHAPARHGDPDMLLKRAWVAVSQLGGDAAILRAMVANERDIVSAYREALQGRGLPDAARATLVRALADERRHLAICDRALERLPPR